MSVFSRRLFVAALVASSTPMAQPVTAADIIPDNDVIMRALVDEMGRSMNLQMEDLEKPYFIQYSVDDSINYQISASYGSVVRSERDRSRRLYSQVRVGTQELDNTNFSGGGGGFFGRRGGRGGSRGAALPIDDAYTALRQAIWWATDDDYKDSVETLTRKRAYMRDKIIEDRPNDFSEAPVVDLLEPGAELAFERRTWEQSLKRITEKFKSYNQIQDSRAQLFVGAGNTYIVNSEGTRLRTADTGALLVITAEGQCADGMRVSSGKSYTGDTTRDLPGVEQIIKDVEAMVADLTAAMNAPILEHYSGPVLFDDVSACQLFQELLSDGVAGKVDPVGQQRSAFEASENLEKKLGHRILPRSFQVYDDPSVERVGDKLLFGHYKFDDEGVKARKVDIVVDGILKDMAMSRVPTKKLSGTNGHARRAPGSGDAAAAIGCLFVDDRNGISQDELRKELIDAARDEGLEYGLRIRSIRSLGLGSSQSDMIAFFMSQQGGDTKLSDPMYAYKVYVADGREELVRGAEFGPIEVRDLKRILAAGDKPTVYNYIAVGGGSATPPSSIIAPPVLLESVELSKIEQEQDQLPILKTPVARNG